MTTSIKKSYPKALPFRSSEDLAAERDAWRRRTYGLLAATAGIVTLTVCGAIFVINHARAARAPVPLALTEEGAAIEPVVAPLSKPAPPVALVAAVPPESISAPEQLEPFPREKFLEVLGSLSAAHLYQTYLSIGLLADGVESEAYTTSEAEETLASISAVMDQVDGQLEKLSKTGLDSADHAALEQIMAVTVLLHQQARSLQDYWTTGDLQKAEEYHEVRKAAWKGMNKVLQGGGS